ncbi:MAG: RIP metalloprotease RseP [Patescibacteria group bacterium]|nr:RIP metalloprotease RseP [Patescibacteria group bacterium]
MLTILLFILILGLLVVAHEFGHFITARKSGMKVFEFGFGFPPRALGFYRDPQSKKFVWIFGSGKKKDQKEKQKSTLANTVGGEEREEEYPSTLWSLNWLPLGGFVKIKGENGENSQDNDSFGAQKAWKKVVVLAAGVTMNVILAFVVLSLGLMIGLPTDLSGGDNDPQAIIIEKPSVVVEQVEDASPAKAAGIQFGDKILRIGSADMNWFEGDRLIGEEINSQKLVTYVNEHSSEEMSLVIERTGQNLVLKITPEMIKNSSTPKLGIALVDAGIIKYPWYLAIYKGFTATFILLANIFVGFYYLLKNLILGNGLIADVAGPVGIATIVGQSAKLGFNYLLNIIAMLSLSLAAINILPIPALDGGRIVFVILEKIFGKPVPMKYEQIAHTIGFLLLMILVVVVTFRDVVKLF